MALKLYIGNKNYSSWSMRPWVLLKQAGIPFEEVMLRFDSFASDSKFKKSLQGVNPVGKVPVLVDDGFTVWDTLAIAEYLAERFPEKALWPTDPQARARARSVCAELHSGFGALRAHCPMNIEASLPDVGRLIWRDQAGVRADMARLCGMWSELLGAQPARLPDGSAPLLFGGFSIADAFYAPVCMRLKTYGLPLPADLAAYVDRVTALPGVQAWIEGALAEQDFLDFEEPYRLGR
jgi:glutathione S-transferase